MTGDSHHIAVIKRGLIPLLADLFVDRLIFRKLATRREGSRLYYTPINPSSPPDKTMKRHEFLLTFATPAFLGNANQDGQWRTPPFKAQLRQWWRAAFAATKAFAPDEAAMRHAEGLLFGHAWLDSDLNASGDKISARKSLIRIRLGQWTEGQLKKSQWEPLAGVSHREVGVAAPADLYLGYGPVAPPTGGRSATLKANAAIQSGEHTTFAIAFPDEHAPLIEQALCLMDRFGAVGGRSRNSWGSYGLVPTDGSPLSGIVPVRDWKDCLQLDWPHAVGCDTKGALIWQTKPAADWRSLMRDLAILKIALRTQFEFPNQSSDGEIHERHWLSYPIKNHSVRAWGNNARLPNSLRFKVRPTAEGKLVGVVFHMPCLPPASFAPDTAAIKSVWAKVHAFLDAPAQNLTRVKA